MTEPTLLQLEVIMLRWKYDVAIKIAAEAQVEAKRMRAALVRVREINAKEIRWKSIVEGIIAKALGDRHD